MSALGKSRWAAFVVRIAVLLLLVGIALLYVRRDMVFDLANFFAACF